MKSATNEPQRQSIFNREEHLSSRNQISDMGRGGKERERERERGKWQIICRAVCRYWEHCKVLGFFNSILNFSSSKTVIQGVTHRLKYHSRGYSLLKFQELVLAWLISRKFFLLIRFSITLFAQLSHPLIDFLQWGKESLWEIWAGCSSWSNMTNASTTLW